MRFEDRNVVITGGSSGIGLETARRFTRLGARVHDLSRRTGVDVTDQAAVTAAIRAIGDDGGIAALVCNAGVMRVGRLGELSLDDFELVLRTNYLGTLYPILAAWPYLEAARESRLAFVSSVAGYTGIYGYSAYAPAKFAMTGLAECLRMEGKPHGIRVTVVFPPDTETPMLEYEHAHAPAETRAISAGARRMSPAAVAEKFVAGIVRGKFEVYCNAESRLIRIIKSLLPGTYYRLLDRLAERT